MKKFFTPNLSRSGRWVRAVLALLLLAGGLITVRQSSGLGFALLIASNLVAFEALRGWCFLRACGIKTRL